MIVSSTGRVPVEQHEQDGTVEFLGQERLRRQHDQAERDADRHNARRRAEAGPTGGLRGLRGENPLHEVDCDDVADAERHQRRPVDGRALRGIGHLAQVERTHAFLDRDAVRDGHPDQQTDRADQNQGHLNDRGVRVGDQSAGPCVGDRENRDDDGAKPVRDADEVVEQKAARHQIPGHQDAEAHDEHHRCRDLDRTAEPQAVVVRERRQPHPVHRLGEEQSGEDQTQREAERQARTRPEPEFGRQVGISEGGVGVDGRAHQGAADQHQRQHAAADEEVGAIAGYSLGNQEADEDDDSDADSDTEKNHGEPPCEVGSLPGFYPAVERPASSSIRLRLSDQTRRIGGTLDAPHK